MAVARRRQSSEVVSKTRSSPSWRRLQHSVSDVASPRSAESLSRSVARQVDTSGDGENDSLLVDSTGDGFYDVALAIDEVGGSTAIAPAFPPRDQAPSDTWRAQASGDTSASSSEREQAVGVIDTVEQAGAGNDDAEQLIVRI